VTRFESTAVTAVAYCDLIKSNKGSGAGALTELYQEANDFVISLLERVSTRRSCAILCFLLHYAIFTLYRSRRFFFPSSLFQIHFVKFLWARYSRKTWNAHIDVDIHCFIFPFICASYMKQKNNNFQGSQLEGIVALSDQGVLHSKRREHSPCGGVDKTVAIRQRSHRCCGQSAVRPRSTWPEYVSERLQALVTRHTLQPLTTNITRYYLTSAVTWIIIVIIIIYLPKRIHK